MATPWTDNVRRSGQLSVYAGPSLRGGQWAVVLREALGEFNRLSRQHRLGISMIRSGDAPTDSGGAHVAVEAASDQISLTYAGTNRSESFDGSRMHGRIFLIERGGRIERAFIFLPRRPQVNTPRGIRGVGQNVMKVIAVHELVHACGLTDAEHSADDLFQGNPQVDPGTNAVRDRVRIQSAGSMSRMPPLVLSGSTARRISALWVP